MNNDFIILFFLWYWLMCALYKDNFLPNKLEQLGDKIKINLIKDLSECKFCMNTWCALIVCSSYALYQWDYRLIIMGFVFSSIEAFVKR